MILSGKQALDPVGLAPTNITAKQLKDTAFPLNFFLLPARGLLNTAPRLGLYYRLVFIRQADCRQPPRPRIKRLDAGKAQTVDELMSRI